MPADLLLAVRPDERLAQGLHLSRAVALLAEDERGGARAGPHGRQRAQQPLQGGGPVEDRDDDREVAHRPTAIAGLEENRCGRPTLRRRRNIPGAAP